MLLSEIKDWLKTKIDCPNWYVGKIDGSVEQCIGIYSIAGGKPNIAIGGLENTSYTVKSISILVHWGKSTTPAEQKAQEIYNAIFGQNAVIGGKKVIEFDMRTTEPVGVGTDENNIYEFVVEVNIIYER
ncbi:minor capsid protein [Clostridium sp. Mt-5]|uniref:Minor capsid protein n=1 Tax=Clostridium moutaii TaxID=3240932 RepID=A0ABV4BRR7_9CLOT